MKICILNIATNKYIQFVEQLLESVEENFLNGHDISALVFTDHEIEEVSDNVKISQIDHRTLASSYSEEISLLYEGERIYFSV